MLKQIVIAASVAGAAMFSAPTSAQAQFSYPGSSSGISPFSYSYNYLNTGNPYNHGQYNYRYYPSYHRRGNVASRYSYSRYNRSSYDRYDRSNRYDKFDRYDRYDNRNRYDRYDNSNRFDNWRR